MRIHPARRKAYAVQTCARGKLARRVTIGRHGVITAEEAWRRAAHIVARIKVGEEPVPGSMTAMLAEGPTVGKMAERYPVEYVALRCKPKTESNNRSVVTKHIVPKLD